MRIVRVIQQHLANIVALRARLAGVRPAGIGKRSKPYGCVHIARAQLPRQPAIEEGVVHHQLLLDRVGQLEPPHPLLDHLGLESAVVRGETQLQTLIHIHIAHDLHAGEADIVFFSHVLNPRRTNDQPDIRNIIEHALAHLHLKGLSPQRVAVQVVVYRVAPDIQSRRLIDVFRQAVHLQANRVQPGLQVRKRITPLGVRGRTRDQPFGEAVPVLIEVELQPDLRLRFFTRVLDAVAVRIDPHEIANDGGL